MAAYEISDHDLPNEELATLREFVDSWEFHRPPVLFVGAGFSKLAARHPDASPYSEFSSRDEVMTDLKNSLSNGGAEIGLPSDPLRLAQYFETQFRRATLLDHLARHVPTADFRPADAHRALRHTPWPAIRNEQSRPVRLWRREA